MNFFPKKSEAVLPLSLGLVFVLPATVLSTMLMIWNNDVPLGKFSEVFGTILMPFFWIGPILSVVMTALAWRIEKTRAAQVVALLDILSIAFQAFIIYSVRD